MEIKENFYDDICRVLTNYEQAAGRQAKEDAIEDMYHLLVDLQSYIDIWSDDN